MKRAIVAGALLIGALAPLACWSGGTSLLSVAESRHYLRNSDDIRHQGALIAGLSMLDGVYVRYGENGTCESSECKQHLIEVLRDVGVAYSELDLHLLSLNYYRAVLRYADDQAISHADVGGEYLMLGRYDEAGAAYAKALAVAEGKNGAVEQYAAAYYFVTDQIGKAREHFLACAQLPGDDKRIQYCAIGLALAKLRGEDDAPAPIAPTAEWPGPVLAYLRGDIDESALARNVEATQEPSMRRERLSEALYYAGELKLRRGDTAAALRYFRANVSLKVGGFLETLLSMRRIEQQRGSDDPPPHATAASHAPIS